MTQPTISRTTLRRFILGRQGLWPGRRWSGHAGTAAAMVACEAIQVDPVNVVARSHDIALWGRVAQYRPEDLDQLIHKERRFFDYGGLLFIWPMAELPYWRAVMERREGMGGRIGAWAAANGPVLDAVRAELRARGPLGARDLEGQSTGIRFYRSSKDTGMALYFLWITGELMTYARRGVDRIYYFRDEIAPPDYRWAASAADSDRYFARKAAAFLGLAPERLWRPWWSLLMNRPVPPAEAQATLRALTEEGVLAAVHIEKEKQPWYSLASDLPLLAELEAGGIPAAWAPLGATTPDAVTFLAPLEIVSARSRSKPVFGFEHVWEIYKKPADRKYGPYTLPVLWGDRLVARLDPKADRKAGTLNVNGLWLEESVRPDDSEFMSALAAGLLGLSSLTGTTRFRVADAVAPDLRKRLESRLT